MCAQSKGNMNQERDSKDKVYAKGIKGFNKGLVCEPVFGCKKQYAEDTVFEEKGGEIGGPGVMHAADAAMNVLEHVPLIDENGDLSEFAEVEALAPVQREGTKWATTKMRIGKKLSFAAFLKKAVRTFNSTVSAIKTQTYALYTFIYDVADYSNLKISSERVKLCSFGDKAYISNTEKDVYTVSLGDKVNICSSGDWTQIGILGDEAVVCTTGDQTRAAISGSQAKVGNSGYGAHIMNSGSCAQIRNVGEYAHICDTGDWSRINSEGKSSKLISSGYCSNIVSSGDKSLVAALGVYAYAAAEKGSWIGLAEYDKHGDCICAKFEFVDGEKIKPGVKYRLKQGKFEEVIESEEPPF